MHLNGFAKGIQKGSSVKQGDIIGYVGATGLATGPHLDYRVHKNNTPIDPLKMEAPPSYPVKPALMDSFLVVRDKVLMELDSMQHTTHNIAQSDSLSQQQFYSESL